MNTLQAIIIGIIEGVTELLPVSSTGHMIVAGKLMNIPQNVVVDAYMIIIQFAAILAVVVIYRDRIIQANYNLWKNIIIAFLPFAAAGYLVKDHIDELFNPFVAAYMFIIGGLVFLVIEYFYKEEDANVLDVDNVSTKNAIIIGLSQILAIVPGTSRSGATIAGGLMLGLDRKSASDFSFLLAIPTMGAVAGYSLLKHYRELAGVDWFPFAVGFAVAFIVAYLTVKLFLVFIQKFSFVPFAIYRILFGIILLLTL